jgi:hypothetical protein
MARRDDEFVTVSIRRSLLIILLFSRAAHEVGKTPAI